MSITLERLEEIMEDYKNAFERYQRIITSLHVSMLLDNQRVIKLLIQECKNGEKISHFKEWNK